jgi:hypothetical protein
MEKEMDFDDEEEDYSFGSAEDEHPLVLPIPMCCDQWFSVECKCAERHAEKIQNYKPPHPIEKKPQLLFSVDDDVCWLYGPL